MKPIAISCGDPSGIGIELILKAWQNKVYYKLPSFFVIGSSQIIQDYIKLLNIKTPIQELSEFNFKNINEIFANALPVLNIAEQQVFSPALPQIINASAIIKSIELAVELIFNKKASALVTAPISKVHLYQANFKFPGHTEFLAYLTKQYTKQDVKPIMMLKAKDLAVVPTTIHIPLKDITQILTSELIIETIEIVHNDLQKRFRIKHPRLTISGLNPHAGENGTMGYEEQTIIQSAINELKLLGINVNGPLPADTMFHKTARSKYDAAICMYHDQALIPIKTLHFDDAVNITLGLPFIRTSPDHGTAFDIAGKNLASPKSFIKAILTAKQMVQNSDGN